MQATTRRRHSSSSALSAPSKEDAVSSSQMYIWKWKKLKFHSFNRGIHNRYPYKTNNNLNKANQIMTINPCWTLACRCGRLEANDFIWKELYFFIHNANFFQSESLNLFEVIKKRDGICKCSVDKIAQLRFVVRMTTTVCCLIKFSRPTTDYFRMQIDITAE